MPFGESRTFELVEKWVRLGRENTIEESEAETQVVNARRAIEKTIGRGYIPSTPLFLLFILMKNDNPIDFKGKITGNSVASIYEAIITFSLTNIQSVTRYVNLEKIQHFLSDLAYYFYNGGQSQVSEYDLLQWFTKRNESKGINLEFNQTIKIVLQADLLAKENDLYRFKYDYATFFYLADYFRSIELKDNFKDEINVLFSKIPNLFELNLIKFITYRCSHPYIARLLIEKSKSLYDSIEPFILPDHLNFLSVYDGIDLEDVIEPINYKPLRKVTLELSDELSEKIESKETESLELLEKPDSKSPQSEGSIHEMFVSSQILDLIGQVLVNMGNSLELTQRTELFYEAVQLARRQMKYITELMKADKSGVVSVMVHLPMNIGADSLSKLDDDTIYNETVTTFITALLYRYAEALTSDEVSIYIKELLQKDDNQFLLLIKMITGMFFSGNGFPYNDLESIRKVNKKFNLTMSIVINLLRVYFLTFNTSESEQKRIISSLRYYKRH